MPQSDQLKNEARRTAGEATDPADKVPTYQELLDGALEDTFPASDPISPGAACKIMEPHTTERDAMDWKLVPGGAAKPQENAAASKGSATVSTPCEARIERPTELSVDGHVSIEAPVGPCTIWQSEERAVLHWKDKDGEHSGWVPLERYRELLADGTLRREHKEDAATGRSQDG